MIRMSVLAATALAGAALATPALAGEVTVTLTNVRADAGDLYVSLQSEAQFMQAAALAGAPVASVGCGAHAQLAARDDHQQAAPHPGRGDGRQR